MVSSLTYRFTVVSNMMAVNASRLEVAMHFPSTRECYKYLKLQVSLSCYSMRLRLLPSGKRSTLEIHVCVFLWWWAVVKDFLRLHHVHHPKCATDVHVQYITIPYTVSRKN